MGKIEYKANPALLSYYSKNLNASNNPQGFTAGEKAQFQNNQAGTINTQLYNANKTSGGNMSRYLAAALNPSLVQSNNTFAVNDAQLAQQNKNASLGRLYGAITQMQGIDNLNTGLRQQTAQALGQSVLQNRNYDQQQIDQFGPRVMNAAAGVYTMGQLGGIKGLFGNGGGNRNITAPMLFGPRSMGGYDPTPFNPDSSLTG